MGGLIELNIRVGKPPGVIDKIVKNLGGCLCSDLEVFGEIKGRSEIEGIWTLRKGDIGMKSVATVEMELTLL